MVRRGELDRAELFFVQGRFPDQILQDALLLQLCKTHHGRCPSFSNSRDRLEELGELLFVAVEAPFVLPVRRVSIVVLVLRVVARVEEVFDVVEEEMDLFFGWGKAGA